MSVPRPALDAGSGCVIGGVFPARAGEPVAAESLRAMAACVTRLPGSVCSGEEPVGLFAAGGGVVERGEEAWVVADLDLVNLDELHEIAGLEAGRSGLMSRLYALEGAGFVRRLRGAFALALWDRRRRQLLLGVDHFGMRRLHYATSPRGTVFSSRLDALLGGPGVEKRVELATVYSYLNFRFVPAPETPYTNVRRLPPGHTLLVRPCHARLEPFWDMAYPEERHREDRAASSVYRLTHQAVQEALTTLSPKETGAFLSGGTDSSTIVGLMTRITGEPVNAFSIGFDDDRYDELRHAGLTARHFGASHYTRVVTADDALAALPGLVSAYDEPFGNNSAVGTFFCAQLGREAGVRHLLAGDGGDEIFGGNERYRTDRIFARYQRLPALLRRGILEPILLNLPGHAPGILGRGQRYIRRANIQNPRRFYSYEFYVAEGAGQLLHPDFLAAIVPDGPWHALEEHYGRVRASTELNRLLYLDLKLTIGDNDLLKVTRTAELAGMAVRFPMLALPLVEYTGTMPADFKVRGLEKRYLFKRAFRSLLPAETLAKRKHGFGVPTAEWLKHHPGFRELCRDVLLSPRTAQRGYFRAGALEHLLSLHAADDTPFYGDILWSVLMLELWHRAHADRTERAG
jgi:asparagine synthase (glutamine-hydrolysing)